MPNLNKVILVGNLVRDPERKVGSSGGTFALFTVAANYRYTSKSGKQQEEAAFVPCIAFGPVIESLMLRKKGALAIVAGRLRTQSWEQNGKRASRLVLVSESVQFATKPPAEEESMTPVPSGNGGGELADADEIPF